MNSGFIAAISVLTAIFLGSLLVLILIVKKKLCKTFDGISDYCRSDNAHQSLVQNMEVACENVADLELGEVASGTASDTWESNIVDLMPHCLGILRTVHLLTDKIVKNSLIESREVQLSDTLTDLEPLARNIGTRVDEVVKSMYPPLDPRLLEARCSALVLSVNNMVLLIKSSTHDTDSHAWMDQGLTQVEGHLKVLREASMTFEKQLTVDEVPEMLGEIKEEDVAEDDELIDIQPSQVTSSSV